MEQLAHFVTKSFEYNNNRVMEVLNMSTKSNSSSISMNNDSSDIISNSDQSVIENDVIDDNGNDDNSVDIDITDLSSNDEKSNVDIMSSPLPLVKKTRECIVNNINNNNNKSSAVTKNWLISDFSPSSRANSITTSKF